MARLEVGEQIRDQPLVVLDYQDFLGHFPLSRRRPRGCHCTRRTSVERFRLTKSEIDATEDCPALGRRIREILAPR